MPTVTVNAAATPTPEVAAHVDLAAGVITEVVFDTGQAGPVQADAVLEVEIIVWSATAPVWFTLDGTDPAVRGRRTLVIPSAPASDLRRPRTFRPSRVKLLSTADAVVSVQRVR